VLNLPADKVKTVYFGPAKHFKRVTDVDNLERIKRRYNFPERFILTLTKRGGGGRKNLGQIFKAYARYHDQTREPHKLVIGGKDCHLFRGEYDIPEDGYGQDILFPGWIGQEDLPAVYSLATLYLYPSNLEAFPIPITEAMACGTPIITSNVNGLKEIAGEAAVIVNPERTDEITDALANVLENENLQKELAIKGLDRSKNFSWEKCARETLENLERLAN
jgi:glycosyltransferase involved in cell wall biosynthesis